MSDHICSKPRDFHILTFVFEQNVQFIKKNMVLFLFKITPYNSKNNEFLWNE